MDQSKILLGYARVSSAEQVHGTSLDDQVRKIKKYADYEEFQLEHIHIDRAESGRKASRPDFDALMERCRQGGVTAIVVSKLDRFGRSVRHLSEAFHELEQLGVEFISIAENIDTSTTTGKFLRNMLAVIAELESDTIRDRMYGGRIALAQAGLWPAGRAPYGYRLVNDGRRNGIEIDEEEEKQLRIAFDGIVKEGMTVGAVVRRLNAHGYKQPEGGPWERSMLRERLARPHYTGTFVWHMAAGDFTIDLPPIFTEIEAELLREALARTARPKNPKAGIFPLTGHLHGSCEHHGDVTWSGRTKKGIRYYRCRGQHEREIDKGNGCKCQYVKADLIEAAVWNQVTALIAEPERLLDYAKENLATRGEQMGVEADQIEEIDRKIAAMEKNLKSELVKWMKQGIDPEMVQDAADGLKAEVQSLKEHRNMMIAWQADNTAQSDRMRRVWEIVEQLHAAITNDSLELRQDIFDALDITVHMGQEHPCNKCGGKGREIVYGQKGGRPSCSQCGGRGNIPELRIQGWLNDLLSEPESSDFDSAPGRETLRRSPRGCTLDMPFPFLMNVQVSNPMPDITTLTLRLPPPRTHCSEGHSLDGNTKTDSLGRVYCLTCKPAGKKTTPTPLKTRCDKHNLPYHRTRGCRSCRQEDDERRRRRLGQKPKIDIDVECGNGHAMTPDLIYTNPKTGKRSCKICRRDAKRRHREKEAAA